MATADRKTRRKIVLRRATEPGDALPDFSLPTRRASRGRWLWTVAALGVVVWLAPIVIAKTTLLNSVLKRSLTDLHGSVHIGQASLGWFSPVRVEKVTLSDASGKPIAYVEGAATEKSLWALLMNRTAPGKIQLDHPRMELVLRDNGSNLEDVLAEYLKPSDKPASAGVDLTIEIVEGTVLLRDETNGGQWQIDKLNSQVTIPAQKTWPLEVALSAILADGGTQGPVQATVSLQDVVGADGLHVSTGHATVQIQQLPLAMCQAVIRRFAPGTQLSGTLQTKIEGEWGVDPRGQALYRLQGQTSVSTLTLAAPWLAGDQLRIRQFDLPCQVSCEGDKLVIEKLSATSDIGQIVCQGSLNGLRHLLTSADPQVWLDSAKHFTGQVVGQIDLAKLAQLLPQTLRVRDDTKITSGQLNVQLTSRDDGNRVGWQGTVETSRLVALHQGTELIWDKPLKVSAAAHEDAGQLTVDRFECHSDFLELQASGTPSSLRMTGVCNLDRLTDELSRFVHLEDIRLAGQGQTSVNLDIATDGTFQATGNAQIMQFALGTTAAQPWTEDQLTLACNVKGLWLNGRPTSLSAGQATVDAGSDRLMLVLTGPVANLASDARWPMDVQLSGATAAWLRRLSPWASFRDDLAIQGQAQVAARLVYSAQGVEVESSQITIQPIKGTIFGIAVDDDAVKLRAAGRWLKPQQRIEITSADIQTSPLAIELQDATVGYSAAQTGAAGKFVVDGNLEKLQRWWQSPGVVPDWMLAGKLIASGQLGYNGVATQIDLTATAQDIVVTPRTGRQMIEPVVKMALRGEYAAQNSTLSIAQCEIASDAIELQTTGQIANLRTTRDLQLSGRTTYDLSKLSRVLQPYLGTGIQLAGRETKSFQLAGPLLAPPQAPADGQFLAIAQQMTAQAQLGWQWASCYGFKAGPTKLEGSLARGLGRLSPTEIPIGQNGRVRIAPEFRLGPGPIEVVHAPGRVMENIEITPEMCEFWIGYIAPMFAGATETSGRFSMDLDALRIPVGDIAKGDAAGRLTIHDVEVGPGPLTREIAVLLGGGGTGKIARESVVPFRLAQGRIYHQNLELAFPDVTIRSQGSVGLDQTISLLIEMPLPQRWLGSNALVASAFKDQIIRLPIGGTVQRPQIDRREIDKVLADMTKTAAQSAVRKEVDQGLNKLFEKIPGLK